MSVEYNSGFDPDAHVQELDGDVVPYVAPLEPPDLLDDLPQPFVSQLPEQVLDIVQEAAKREGELRRNGAHPERINKVAHLPMSRALALLASRRVDVSLALPPEVPRNNQLDSVGKFTEKEEQDVDRLVDSAGMDENAARQLVAARR